MTGTDHDHDDPEVDGKPIGRRTILGLIALAGAGVVGGKSIQDGLAKILAPVELRDPTGLISLIPVGDSFRFYSVTSAVPTMNAQTYRLAIDGMVRHTASYTLADLQAMPQTSLVRDFQCITGWQVPQVHWSGVRLSTLLDRAAPTAGATAVRFRSFHRTYTESLTLEQARLDDVIVALQMLAGPITHDHGGSVRMYVAPMYGYKSMKWLSGFELTADVEPGYLGASRLSGRRFHRPVARPRRMTARFGGSERSPVLCIGPPRF